MKKVYKLREEVEMVLVITVFALIIGVGVIVGINRFEKIDNGEITVISQTQMAERQ